MWFQLYIKPNGNQTVDSLQTLGVTSAVQPYEYIGGGVIGDRQNVVEFDSKGMRKLRTGDQIAIQFVTTVDTGTTVDNEVFYYTDLFMGQN